MKDDYDEYYSNDFVDILAQEQQSLGYDIQDIIYMIELGLISVGSIFALIIFTLWFFATRPVRIFIYSSMINFSYNLKLIGKLLTCQDPIYDLVCYYLSKTKVSLTRLDYKKYLKSFTQLERQLNLDKNEAKYLLKYLDKLKPDHSLLQLVEKYEKEMQQLILSRQFKPQNNSNPCYVIGVKEIDASASSAEESSLDAQTVFPNSQNIEESTKLIVVGEPLVGEEVEYLEIEDEKDLIGFDSDKEIVVKIETSKKETSLIDLTAVVDTKEQIELAKDQPTTEEVPKPFPLPLPEDDGSLRAVQPKRLDLSKLLETKDKITKPLKPTVIVEERPLLPVSKPVTLAPAEEEKIKEVEAKVPKPKPAEEEEIFKVEQKKQDLSILESKDKICKPVKSVAIVVDKPRVDVSKRFSLRAEEEAKEAKVSKVEQKKEDMSVSRTRDTICKLHKRVVIDTDKAHVHEPEVIHRPSSIDKLLKVVGTDRCISCKQNRISPCNHIYRNIRYFDTKRFWEKRQQNKRH